MIRVGPTHEESKRRRLLKKIEKLLEEPKKVRRLRPKPADIEVVERLGTIRVTPLTRAGRDWLEENIHVDVEARLGASVDFTRDVLKPLVRGAKREGIRVRGSVE